MPEQHALLSASSAHRWLHCTRAPRLEERLPDRGSPYAAAGTLAHAIAELKARRYFAGMPEREYRGRLRQLKASEHYDRGMDAATDCYLDHLKARAMGYPQPPFAALESRVDYSYLAPSGFGTADAILIGSGQMDVVDYKNGAGVPVEAEHNPQMMLYALGALSVYRPIYGESIRTVHLSIVQPHAGGVKEWELPSEELLRWGEETVRPAAALAWAGEGDFRPGSWCRFCRAKAQCRARAEALLAVEPGERTLAAGSLSPEARAQAEAAGTVLLDDAQVGEVLGRALELEAWVKDLKDYALSAALAGREIAGFKLVAGRSSRVWEDLETAFQILPERGVDPALLWERTPITVAKLEKALGKRAFSGVSAGLVAASPGKPALAPAGDRRPAWSPARAAFGTVEEEQ